jgi:hypothetical protein
LQKYALEQKEIVAKAAIDAIFKQFESGKRTKKGAKKSTDSINFIIEIIDDTSTTLDVSAAVHSSGEKMKQEIPKK